MEQRPTLSRRFPWESRTHTSDGCSTAQGRGAKGENEYKFSLEFLEPVKPEVPIGGAAGKYLRPHPSDGFLSNGVQVRHRSTQRQVDIKIRKQQERWWDRLTRQEKRPLFLAPDFDRWLDESDAEMELQAKVGGWQGNVEAAVGAGGKRRLRGGVWGGSSGPAWVSSLWVYVKKLQNVQLWNPGIVAVMSSRRRGR